MDIMLGLDFGTQSAKGLIINKSGNVLSKAQASYTLHTDNPGEVCQDPKDWIYALKQICTELRRTPFYKDIMSIGITGQMHTLVFLDKDNDALCPSILWNDTRGMAQCAEIYDMTESVDLVNPVTTPYSAVKLLYMKKENPELFAKISKVVFVKDYIRYMLTGDLYTDPTDASGSLLFDFQTGSWSRDTIKRLGFQQTIFPEIRPSYSMLSHLSEEGARLTGFKQGTPVACGCGDLAAGLVGGGVVKNGDTLIILGTSGQVLNLSGSIEENTKGKMYFFQGPDGHKIMSLCALPSAGYSYRWAAGILAKEKSFSEIDALAETVSPGAEGVLFAPYINGTGSPYMDSEVKAAFFGLTNSHNEQHMLRAVLEGVCFGVKACVQLYHKDRTHIYFAGGGAKSNLWMQIMANVLEADLRICAVEDSSPLGAAAISGLCAGIFSSEEACSQIVKISKTVAFDEASVQIYGAIFQKYLRAYEAVGIMK